MVMVPSACIFTVPPPHKRAASTAWRKRRPSMSVPGAGCRAALLRPDGAAAALPPLLCAPAVTAARLLQGPPGARYAVRTVRPARGRHYPRGEQPRQERQQQSVDAKLGCDGAPNVCVLERQPSRHAAGAPPMNTCREHWRPQRCRPRGRHVARRPASCEGGDPRLGGRNQDLGRGGGPPYPVRCTEKAALGLWRCLRRRGPPERGPRGTCHKTGRPWSGTTIDLHCLALPTRIVSGSLHHV